MIIFMRLIIGFSLVLSALVFAFPMADSYAATEISDEASRQLTSQLQPPAKEDDLITPKTEEKPKISVDEKQPDALPDGPKFFVKTIRLEGNTVISEKELRPPIALYENTEQTFASLGKLVQALTDIYHAKGYLTSRAYLPPQKIENQTVTIKILEGKTGKVIVEGNRFFDQQLYSSAVRMEEGKIFRYQDLENSLYLLNREADRKAQAYLVAGAEPETSDIVLKAEEVFPIHIYYEFNNRGTKLTHRGRHYVHADHNNLFGKGDAFKSSLGLAEEGALESYAGVYEFPITKTGTQLGLNLGYVKTMLIGHLKPFEIKGESLDVTPYLTQELIKTPQFQLGLYTAFEIKDSKTLVDDLKVNFDRSRAWVLGPRLTLQDAGGRTVLSSDVHWGIPEFFGSNEEVDVNASRVNSGGDFLYYTGSVARVQRTLWDTYIIAKAGGQWTRDTLSSIEQFRAGGAYSVRGYPESDSAGDYGHNFSFELYSPVPFLPVDWEIPFTQKTWRDAVRIVGFVDGAKTYLRERNRETDVKSRYLLGTGFGIRVNITDSFSLQTDLGYPIGDDSTDEHQMQVHMSLKAGF